MYQFPVAEFAMFFVMSDEDFFRDAGSIICGNEDGIDQEIFILCSINRWLCESRFEMDRL